MKLSKSLVALLALVLITVPAWAGKFETGKQESGNNVKFEVSAPLETIIGNTAVVSGYFDFDPNNVKASKGARFEVDVASFDSGIALRDEHFRDKYLHTKKHPKAVFTLGKIISASRNKVKSGESADLEIEGTLDLHGVKKKERVKATVTYVKGSKATKNMLPGNIVAINANFRIKLADYNIERPEMLVLRLGDEVDINMFTRLTDAPHEMAKGACGGCGGCGGGCGGCGGGCGGCGGCDGGCGGCGGCDGGCGGCGGCGG